MLENNLYYQDNYMFFTFDNIRSDIWNIYIKNDNKGLIFYQNKGAVNFASPEYFREQYALGVTYSQYTFPLNLVGYGLTRSELNSILSWLKVGKTGKLTFDYADGWYYSTIISSVSEPTLSNIDDEHFIAEFSVEFKTNGKGYAIKEVQYSSTNFKNIPFITYSQGQYYVCFLDEGTFNVKLSKNIEANIDTDATWEINISYNNKQLSSNKLQLKNLLDSSIKLSFNLQQAQFLIDDILPEAAQQQNIIQIISNSIFVNNNLYVSKSSVIKTLPEETDGYFFLNLTALFSAEVGSSEEVCKISPTNEERIVIKNWLESGCQVYMGAPLVIASGSNDALTITAYKEGV